MKNHPKYSSRGGHYPAHSANPPYSEMENVIQSGVKLSSRHIRRGLVRRFENNGFEELNVGGLSGVLADGQTPAAHATSHQNNGTDEINVVGLSGLLADGQTPLAHKTSHQNNGTDEIDMTGLGGVLNDAQKVEIEDAGVLVAARPILDFEGTAVTSIVDDSGNNRIVITLDASAGGGTLTIAPKTADHTILTSESGFVFTNEGAGANVNFTLPAAAAGLTYEFMVHTALPFLIHADTGDTIRIAATVSATGGQIAVGTAGHTVRLVCMNATEWVAMSVIGTWTVT